MYSACTVQGGKNGVVMVIVVYCVIIYLRLKRKGGGEMYICTHDQILYNISLKI